LLPLLLHQTIPNPFQLFVVLNQSKWLSNKKRGKIQPITSMLKIWRVLSKLPQTKENGVKWVGTHSGSFHADECLACALLSHTKEFSDMIIIRSRDPQILSKCDILVDVGGKYDPKHHLYDHHQREFQDTFPEFKTRLSSAGLVYLHFGMELIQQKVSNEKYAKKIFKKVYKNFIEHMDGIDNGVTVSGDRAPLYNISTDLSSRVGSLGPDWTCPDDKIEELTLEGFKKALTLTETEFYQYFDFLVNSWLPARDIVEKCLTKHWCDEKGEIILLEKFCPWQEHLYEIERDMGISGHTKFVILYEAREKAWRTRAVSVEGDGFKSRMQIKKEWCGLREEELQKASGVEDAIFVHATGFIGGARSFEGAVALAKNTILSHQ
jgi:uncharacterized UPF0160 family protein